MLEKTSTKTSGRPQFIFGNEMCGYNQILSFKPYGKLLKQHRKLVHQQLGTKTAASRFRDIQHVESRRLLLRILESPEKLFEHIKTEASAIILKMTYGYNLEPHKPNPLALLIEQMMQNFSLAFVPMSWPVDILPIIRYLPETLPGMSFKRIARDWNANMRMVVDLPYALVKKQIAKQSNRASYVSSLLKQHDGDVDEETEDAIKQTAAVMYAGGADTTVSSIRGFVLAMLLFPDVQRKAQKEIDSAVGNERLPQFEDRDNLPYVDALIKETLRWIPVTPMGVVHTADEDIHYKDFVIPKGASFLPATWWFLHDPVIYKDPSTFDPGRYLEPRNEPHPNFASFGFGRRVCPGRFLADESLFISISRLLATFEIKKTVDGRGNEIEPQISVTPGMIGHIRDFPYDIKPRSENRGRSKPEHPPGSNERKLFGLTSWHDAGSDADIECVAFSGFLFIAGRLTSEPVSIVFVHGLMGDRHKTWRGTSSNGVKLEPWPKLLLSEDIPRSRILSFGYDARVINTDSASGRIPAESASEHARELVYTLRDFRSETRTVGRKIMFAMCFSHRRSTQNYHDIWKSTVGIVFIGTPHRGSKQSRSAITAASLLGMFMDTNINLLEILNESSELRDRLDEEFQALQESRRIPTSCFWEALPSKRGGIIVPKESATLGGDRGRAIHADHSSMVKFTSATDEGYKAVRSTIKDMLSIAEKQPPRLTQGLPHRTVGHANQSSVWFISPSKNPIFSGRKSELDKLTDCLGISATGLTETSHKRAAIWGVGGMGKTQLAAQWVAEMNEKHGHSVFWVHGGSIERFGESYAKIARCCEIPRCDVDNPQLPQSTMLENVKKWFEDQAQKGSWAMVVDNVDDVEVFGETKDLDTAPVTLRDYLPSCDHGSILFTTRSREIAEMLADPDKTVMVDEMTTDDCIELMRKKLASTAYDDANLAELAAELEHLPLALIQATAYLSKRKEQIPRYLQRLRHARSLIVNRPHEAEATVLKDEHGRYSALARTLMITFDAIQSENTLAMELLKLMSFYERQEIPRSLFICYAHNYELFTTGIFVRGPEWDDWQPAGNVSPPTDDQINEALSLLEHYCALTKGRDEGAVTLHRLVHIVLRSQVKSNHDTAREMAAKAMAIMCNTFPVPNADNWTQMQQLMPHAKAVLNEQDMDLNGGLAINSKFRLLSHITEFVSRFLQDKNHPIDPLSPVWESVLNKMDEVIGIYHSRSLQAKLDHVRFFQPDNRDRVKALVTEIQEKIGDGERWLSTKTSLASILYRSGYMEEAGSFLDSFIDQVFRSKGSSNPITNAAVWYRARAFALLGQLDEALALIRERMRVQGQEGADYAVARLVLFAGLLNAASGNDDEALGLWALYLRQVERFWAHDHYMVVEHKEDLLRAKESFYSGRPIYESNYEAMRHKEAADKRKGSSIHARPDNTSASTRITSILSQYSKGQAQRDTLISHDWRCAWSWTYFPALKQDWPLCKRELEADGFDIGPPLENTECQD
ncbi:O-methylsterigmatocystin oxidoreductase [Fusarium agapanthi]|uniref:O-methylsterigmatocystin oxidoreductase n=1 Tax=Fusarium agapanthi TaxID=1803897 RepID=A0A9P5EB52_9HYPO|nr:O-methylsterigmatocystin oxidoreductase [Fusarium agapanthi]